MEKNSKKIIINCVTDIMLFACLTAIDQITKIFARKALIDNKTINIIKNVFVLNLVKNRGSAWGMFSGKINFLLIVTVAFTAILIVLYIKMVKYDKYRILIFIDAVMIAGAVGNLIDRIVFGYVTDFFDFTLINFPVFNFADICITVSAAVLIILMFTKYKNDNFECLKGSKKKENNADNSTQC